jgi:adenylylsulfate kinase
MNKNIISHNFTITKDSRHKRNNHNSFLIWFTGLSGSGKSTIANALELELYVKRVNTYLLDGDNIRSRINKDLLFSPEDRRENIRRISEISNLFIDAGVVVLSAFVSPYRKDREYVLEIVGQDNVITVFVNTSIEECERRDVKGLYKKARAGEINNFTGVNAPYEDPLHPDIEIDTEKMSIEESVEKIMYVVNRKLKYE